MAGDHVLRRDKQRFTNCREAIPQIRALLRKFRDDFQVDSEQILGELECKHVGATFEDVPMNCFDGNRH